MIEEVEAVFRRHMEAAPYARDLIKRIAFEVVPLLPPVTEPVAWFVRDWADDWISFDNEADAKHYVEMSGALMIYAYKEPRT